MLRLCLLLAFFVSSSFSQFRFPVPVFQALRPKGFRITIADRPDIELFAFQGRINEEIPSNTLGDISADVRQVNGKLVYYDPDLQLKVGDVVNYWFYVQVNKAGYVQSDKKWQVKDLVVYNEQDCANPSTITSLTDMDICAGTVFFEDDFTGGEINRNLWTVEEYIPFYSDDRDNFEFVSYEDVNECRFQSNSNLFLKPVLRSNVRGKLELKKCTRPNSAKEACLYIQHGANILPPVKSAKITSKMSFKYGRVEIRAKLPLGDWIYPQIELIPLDSTTQYPKILIAYARGNEKLTFENGSDIGSRHLLGGYITTSDEPQRSEALKSTDLSSPVGQGMHVFTVTWTPNKIQFMVDNNMYGEETNLDTSDEYRISLGVGVGGVVDFPDNTRSGAFNKPWKNGDAKIMLNFLEDKDAWASTWNGNNVALQVDYVKVFAV